MKLRLFDYQNVSFSSNVIYLYLNRLLSQIGIGIYGVFGVIFFFEKFGNSLKDVLLLFGILYLIFFFTTHLGAKFIYLIGMKKLMMIATLFLALTTYALFMWNDNPFLYLLMFCLGLIIYKMFYWIPYHVEFAEFTSQKNRGKQIAALSNISEGIMAVLPIIGGFILAREGYEILFLVATVLIFLSIVPLFFMKETKERYTWSFFKLIKEFFSKKTRTTVVSNFANGVQDGVGTIIWPIFIFVLLKGDYLFVGAITTLTIVALIILRFAVGGAVDRLGEKKVLNMGSIFYTSGWLIKIFVETGTGIFLSHTYHNFGKVVNQVSFDSTVYDQAADNGHFVDEFTVLKESSLLLGKGLLLLVAISVIGLFGVTATFVIAAVASLLMSLASKRVSI